MKRFWLTLLALMLPLCAFAEQATAPLELAEQVTASYAYPEDAPRYVLTVSYPQFVAQQEADERINQAFRSMLEDLMGYRREQGVGEEELAEPDMPPTTVTITWRVMRNDAQYLSVVLDESILSGNAETSAQSAVTFARDGVYADGVSLSLSQALGLEQEGGELEDVQSVAAQLVYRLVWNIVEEQRQNIEADFIDDLTEEALQASFDPETDYYLDADGNIVFFIEAGAIAGAIAGTLEYPFAPAELLSAMAGG